MKAELIVIENDADLAEATALVAKLMKKPGSGAKLRAQAKLVEDYESRKWPRRAVEPPALLTYLMDQHGLNDKNGKNGKNG